MGDDARDKMEWLNEMIEAVESFEQVVPVAGFPDSRSFRKYVVHQAVTKKPNHGAHSLSVLGGETGHWVIVRSHVYS